MRNSSSSFSRFPICRWLSLRQGAAGGEQNCLPVEYVLDRGNRALVQKLFGKRDVLQPVALDDEPRFQGACGAALRVSPPLRRVSSIANRAGKSTCLTHSQ